MNASPLTLRSFVWRVLASHMVTYFLAGLAAFTLFDYHSLYAETELRHLMRPTESAWVAAGPGLQFIRGTLFGLILWPFSSRLMSAGWRGALELFGLVCGLAVLGAAGPAPGSLEGFLFTTIPPRVQLLGLPEVIVQTAAFSFLVSWWCHHPRRWLNIAGGVAVALVMLMSALGTLAAVGTLRP